MPVKPTYQTTGFFLWRHEWEVGIKNRLSEKYPFLLSFRKILLETLKSDTQGFRQGLLQWSYYVENLFVL